MDIKEIRGIKWYVLKYNIGMGVDKMKQEGSIPKFIIAFLAFYIVLSLVVKTVDSVDIYSIINKFVADKMPAGKYLIESETEVKYGNLILDGIMNMNPLISYIKNNDDLIVDDLGDPAPVILAEAEDNEQKSDKTEINMLQNSETENAATENEESQSSDISKDTEEELEADKTTEAAGVFKIPKMTGVKYSINKLSDFDFLLNNFYVVSASTVVYKSDLNPKVLMKKDMSMKQDNSKPQILIYHTHSQETFADSVEGEKDMSIVGVGSYLTKILKEQYGYNVIHLKDKFDMKDGKLDRHKAYDYAYDKVSQVLADNPSIEVIIDLHRDGVNESLHFVTEINGKKTAKIMFFNGLSRLASIGEIDYLHNPYREDNLALSMQMKMNAEAYYPGFTRKNYLHAYEYNLSLRPKSMLIEAGAQTNTFKEELNAMEPLAVLLHMTLSGEKKASDTKS